MMSKGRVSKETIDLPGTMNNRQTVGWRKRPEALLEPYLTVDEEVHAYLKRCPKASVRDIAMECNMTETQARKYYQCPKNARQDEIMQILAHGPKTTKEIAEKLRISERNAWYAISNLYGTGKIEKKVVWRVRCQQ